MVTPKKIPATKILPLGRYKERLFKGKAKSQLVLKIRRYK